MPDEESVFVRILCFDKNGCLWVGTNSGLFTLNTISDKAVKISLPYNNNEDDEIWEIYQDKEGM